MPRPDCFEWYQGESSEGSDAMLEQRAGSKTSAGGEQEAAGAAPARPGEGFQQAPSFRLGDGVRQMTKDLLASGKEAEFYLWLEQRLSSDRLEFMGRLQKVMRQQLASHHNFLLDEIESRTDQPKSVWNKAKSDLEKSVKFCPAQSYDQALATMSLPSNSSVADSTSAMGQAISLKLSERGGSKSSPTSDASPTLSMKKKKNKYRSAYMDNLSDARTRTGIFAESPLPLVDRVVGDPRFEFFSVALILVNMFVMSLEVQYQGCEIARNLAHPDAYGVCTMFDIGVNVDIFFTILTACFSAIFTAELLLRASSLRCQAFVSGWMWFDFTVLTFGIVDTMSRVGSAASLSFNPAAMRTARIARMLRLVKVFKGKESFHVFFLLMKSLLASRHALGWSLSILFVAMTCFGLVMNQAMYSYLTDPDKDEKERLAVFSYYGTYTRLIITMFEITLGNWAPPNRVLMDNVGQYWGIFITVYRCLFCFALVNVSSAVFITETGRVASDDEVLMMRKEKNEKRTAQVLEELFTEIDTSNDGCITLEELKLALEDNLMQNLLEILELDLQDIEELFAVMDRGAGSVPREDFIGAILRMRGQAKTSKLVATMLLIKNLDAKFADLSKTVASIANAVVGNDIMQAKAHQCISPKNSFCTWQKRGALAANPSMSQSLSVTNNPSLAPSITPLPSQPVAQSRSSRSISG